MPRLLLLLLLALPLALPAQVKVGIKSPKSGKNESADKKTLTALDAKFQYALEQFNVPGMAVAIVKDGTVIHSKGYGVADVRTGAKVDDQTVFAIASNTKAFTSASLAMLVDEGKLGWSDKVHTHLPEFQLYDPYVSSELTVRDLLCHRSGLATFSGDVIWYGSTWSRAEVMRRARFLEPTSGFREQFGYQNILFLTAGEIIPRVTDLSWDDFVKSRLLNPLGMNRTSTTIRELPSSNVAAPHNEVKGKNVAIDWVNWDNIGPAGSLNSSVADISQWIKLQLGKGTLNDKIYWEEARTWEMWENVTPTRVSNWQRTHMPSRHFNGYGLGWQLMEYRGAKVVSHGGGYDGFISQTVLIPEKNIGFVILTNSNNSLPSCLMFEVLDAFLGGSGETDWVKLFLGYKMEGIDADVKAAEEDKAARQADKKHSLPINEYCGTYFSELYGNVVISPSMEDSGGLRITFEPTPLHTATLSHWHYDTFLLEWEKQHMLPKGKVTFILDAEGKVSEMKVDVPNPDLDFGELKLLKIN